MLADIENKPERIRLYALLILSNLSLRDGLRYKILEAQGLKIFLQIVKKE